MHAEPLTHLSSSAAPFYSNRGPPWPVQSTVSCVEDTQQRKARSLPRKAGGDVRCSASQKEEKEERKRVKAEEPPPQLRTLVLTLVSLRYYYLSPNDYLSPNYYD